MSNTADQPENQAPSKVGDVDSQVTASNTDDRVKQLTPAEYDASPWLHLYAQYAWHDEARIVGNREALTALRDAIDRALADKNGEAEFAAVAGDGEGYRVDIRRVPRRAVQNSAVPYTADYARWRP